MLPAPSFAAAAAKSAGSAQREQAVCEAAVTLWEWSCAHSLARLAADPALLSSSTLFLVFGRVNVLAEKVLLLVDFLAALVFFSTSLLIFVAFHTALG